MTHTTAPADVPLGELRARQQAVLARRDQAHQTAADAGQAFASIDAAHRAALLDGDITAADALYPELADARQRRDQVADEVARLTDAAHALDAAAQRAEHVAAAAEHDRQRDTAVAEYQQALVTAAAALRAASAAALAVRAAARAAAGHAEQAHRHRLAIAQQDHGDRWHEHLTERYFGAEGTLWEASTNAQPLYSLLAGERLDGVPAPYEPGAVQ